tara:strand:- start:1864 stop:2004 length:141 start_codon:yes stop_codon:yes gene_type:complete
VVIKAHLFHVIETTSNKKIDLNVVMRFFKIITEAVIIVAIYTKNEI